MMKDLNRWLVGAFLALALSPAAWADAEEEDCADFAGTYRVEGLADAEDALERVTLHQVGCDTILAVGSTIQVGATREEKVTTPDGMVTQSTSTAQWNQTKDILTVRFSGSVKIGDFTQTFQGATTLREVEGGLEASNTVDGETTVVRYRRLEE
jgi:hypothetical protein